MGVKPDPLIVIGVLSRSTGLSERTMSGASPVAPTLGLSTECSHEHANSSGATKPTTRSARGNRMSNLPFDSLSIGPAAHAGYRLLRDEQRDAAAIGFSVRRGA